MQTSRTHGFTLIEIMVAISVFLVIMVISMGAILSVFAANSTSQSQKAILDNLNSALETMSREIRFGSNYHCEASWSGPSNITVPLDCSGQGGTPNGGQMISFLSSDGQQIVYRLNGHVLEKSIDSGSTFIPVTSPDTFIDSDRFKFYVVGSDPNDTRQAKVFIRIGGTSGAKATTRSDFSIQTLISQRKLDHAS